VSELDAIGLISQSVHEECYLHVGRMSMGISKDRGNRQDHDRVAMGGCARGTNR
jgi:hypothetical protein